ncbi:MAG: autotransporter outer membrane beta-barrel domain-containing protein, partial [Myxococcales bacterium]|nr:autotransporter outer membrane beta-barrel domain-containing protein [Myxococcales bacterium]
IGGSIANKSEFGLAGIKKAREREAGLIDGDKDNYPIIDASSSILEMLTGGSTGTGILHSNALFQLIVEYNDDPANRGPCSDTEVCLFTEFDPMLVDDAETSNQIAMAEVLDAAYDCANMIGGCDIAMDLATDFRDLYGNFAVTSEEIPDILDTIAGEEYAAFSDVRSAAAARFNRSISRRFDLEFTVESDDDDEAEASEGNGSDPAVGDVSAPGPTWKALGSGARNTRSYRDYRNSRNAWRRQGRPLKDPMPIARHSGKGGFTAWLDVHGVFGELGGGSNADDIDYSIFGPLFGLDYGVSEHITMGVTMGYTRNEMDTPGSAFKGTGDTFQGGAYVGAVFESFHLVGSVRYAYSDLESKRRVRFNTLDRTATADFDARDTSIFLEAAYHFKPMGNVIIQPMFSMAYDHLDQASFDENGAQSLNLQLDKQEFDTVQTSLGVRVAMFGRDSEKRYLLPQFRFAYEREWLDNARSMSAFLPTAGPMGEFQIKGATLPRDRVVIGVSSEVGVSDRINLFVDYDLRAGEDLLEHSLAFGFRAIW